MLSYAYDLDKKRGANPPSPLLSQFSASRGRLFETGQNDNFTDVSKAASTNETLDTLDLEPPSQESLLLDHIQKLLEAGEIEAAAEQIKAIELSGPDLDFSINETQRLNDLARRTDELLKDDLPLGQPAPSLDPLKEIEDMTVGLGFSLPLLVLF